MRSRADRAIIPSDPDRDLEACGTPTIPQPVANAAGPPVHPTESWGCRRKTPAALSGSGAVPRGFAGRGAAGGVSARRAAITSEHGPTGDPWPDRPEVSAGLSSPHAGVIMWLSRRSAANRGGRHRGARPTVLRREGIRSSGVE